MLYMVTRATEEENRLRKGSQFVTVVKRERYFDQERGLHGIYTEKICNVRTLLPSFIKVFVPESKSILVEKVRLPHQSLLVLSFIALFALYYIFSCITDTSSHTTASFLRFPYR